LILHFGRLLYGKRNYGFQHSSIVTTFSLYSWFAWFFSISSASVSTYLIFSWSIFSVVSSLFLILRNIFFKSCYCTLISTGWPKSHCTEKNWISLLRLKQTDWVFTNNKHTLILHIHIDKIRESLFLSIAIGTGANERKAT